MKTTFNAVIGSILAIGLGFTLIAPAQPSPDRGSVRIPESTHPEVRDGLVSPTLSDEQQTGTVRDTIRVLPPVQVDIVPLTGPVKAGQKVEFSALAASGAPTSYAWDFGDGQSATGAKVTHAFIKPGFYPVKVTAAEGRITDDCLALVRAHTTDTLHIPQVLLDTDAKN